MKKNESNLLYDGEFRKIEQPDGGVAYEMIKLDGSGKIRSYSVFPGIQLIYNDFHIETCPHHKPMHADMLEIHYCREGRFECEFINGMYTYLSDGDLAVNSIMTNRPVNATFPLKHYHGVAILIDIKEAARVVSSVLQDVSLDLYALRERLCPKNRCFIIRAKDSIQHIFFELYTIPDEIKYGYFKVKVLELLLFLSALDITEQFEKRMYFPKNPVNKVKQIKQFLVSHMARHFTLEELADRFSISLTTMNSCFKAVYGMPVYTYLRMYRMQAAAIMLLTSQESITVIAGNVGYENSSKFASAFKTVMHQSPSAYRKSR